jgi:hypothetical protein
VTILRTGQMPAQEKLAYLVSTMAGSGIKSAQRKSCAVQTNCQASTDVLHG